MTRSNVKNVSSISYKNALICMGVGFVISWVGFCAGTMYGRALERKVQSSVVNVRIDKLEAQDLADLVEVLEGNDLKIELASLVLDFSKEADGGQGKNAEH